MQNLAYNNFNFKKQALLTEIYGECKSISSMLVHVVLYHAQGEILGINMWLTYRLKRKLGQWMAEY